MYARHTETETSLIVLHLNELMFSNNSSGITAYISDVNRIGEMEVGIFGPDGRPAFGTTMTDTMRPLPDQMQTFSRTDHSIIYTRKLSNDKRCHSCHNPKDETRGMVVIGHSLDRMEQEIGKTVRNIVWFALFLGITSELFLIGIMKKMILGPVKELNQGARMLKDGRLDHRLEKKSDDEIGSLVSCFNETAASLEQARANLENKVRQRTKELKTAAELTVHMLKADMPLDSLTGHFLAAITRDLEYRFAALCLLDRETGRLVQVHREGTDADFCARELSLASDHPFLQAVREARSAVRKAGEIGFPDDETIVIIPIVSRQRNRCSTINLCTLENCPAYANPDDRCWLMENTLCRSPLAVAGKEKIYGCVHCPVFPMLGVLIAGRSGAVTEASLQSLEIIASELTTSIENQRFIDGKKQDIENLVNLHDISVDVLQDLDAERLNRSIISSAIAFANADAAILWLKSDDGRLHLAAWSGTDRSYLPDTIEQDSSFTGKALREARVVETVRIPEVPCLHDFLQSTGFLYVASVPLLHKDDAYGCMTILKKKDFLMTDSERAIIQLFSSQAAAAIHTAQLYQSLVESENRYKDLIHRAEDVIYTLSPEGIFTSLNPAFETITGWSCGDWLGRPFALLIHPDDRLRALEIFRHVLGGGLQQLFELRILKSNEEFLTGEFRVAARFQGGSLLHVMGIGRDVTERKRFEEERIGLIADLNSQKEFSETIFNTMTMGVMVIDSEGSVLRINRAGAEILQVTRSEIAGRKIDDVFPDLSEFLILRGNIGRETSVSGDGRIIPIGYTNSPLLDLDGQQQGTVVVFRDLTEIRKLQAEVTRREHYATVGKVLFGVAHEIRNPLFGISSIAQILERELSTPEHLALIRALLKESGRMTHLMEELLLYARPSRLDLQDVRLGNLMDEIRHSLLFRRQGIRIDEHIPAGFLVRADGEKIRQVLLNLIGNAIDAAASSVIISAARERGSAVITITDNGPGIPEADREKVFEPFFTTKKGGTGLGLPICKKILDDHGGTIEIGASAHGGTVITVTLRG